MSKSSSLHNNDRFLTLSGQLSLSDNVSAYTIENGARISIKTTSGNDDREPVNPAKKEDYPDVKFWTHQDFKRWERTDGLCAAADQGSLPFLEKCDGNVFSPNELRDVMKTFRSVWFGLTHQDKAPASWGKAIPAAKNWLYTEVSRAVTRQQLLNTTRNKCVRPKSPSAGNKVRRYNHESNAKASGPMFFGFSGLAGFGCGFSGLRRIMTTNVGKASGQSNIYVKVVVEYFRSKVHVNKHEALRTMGKHVIALAMTGASKTGQDTDRTSAQENIGSDAWETSAVQATLHARDVDVKPLGHAESKQGDVSIATQEDSITKDLDCADQPKRARVDNKDADPSTETSTTINVIQVATPKSPSVIVPAPRPVILLKNPFKDTIKLLKEKHEDSAAQKQLQILNDTPPSMATSSPSTSTAAPTAPAPMLIDSMSESTSADDTTAPARTSNLDILMPVTTTPIPTTIVTVPISTAVTGVPVPTTSNSKDTTTAPMNTTNTKKFCPATTKNGRNHCTHRWLKQLMPNRSSQDFKVYWDSLEKTRQASYDIEASSLVADSVWTVNTVDILAKFSSGTLH
ncbi:uncharacterized protein HD556DRAFT_1312040 [Suillus plorans]|uniref:Uncharacterized protein n=1 Tax=Suillus plorans TaxID=116603 RepID=A0A9P7AHA1_9AGAM|nr:uncharacterized protein HD556DRAFT_1312040 [Suillus plorans]KAG1788450.1 hypothetical protein HD556DRAFT_1312040 [Suillus plorans]